MKTKSAVILTSLAGLFLVSACGQEGPLYLPGEPSSRSSTIPKQEEAPSKTEEEKKEQQDNQGIQ